MLRTLPFSLLHAARGTRHASCLALVMLLAAPAFAAAPETNSIPRRDALAAGGRGAFAPLPPFVAAPEPPKRSLVPLLTRPWLPPAGGLQTPRLLPADRHGRLPLRPVADRPDIAIVPGPVRFFRTGAGAYAAAPDSGDIATVNLGPHAAPGPSTRIVALPTAKPVQGHRWLPTSLQWAMRLRAVHDSALLERAADPFATRPPRMLILPPAVGSSPEVTEAPIVSAAFLPVPDRQPAASDPTWDLSYQAAIARRVELSRPAAPFVRLVIPDPFETVALVQLRKPPPDADPPSAAPGLPPRPTFPIKPQ